MQIEGNPRGELPRSGQEPEYQQQSQQHERRARQHKQPVRRIEQHESQVAPAIPETAQMRGAPALVGPQGDRDFRHFGAQLGRLDHELGGKLHSGAAQIHLLVYGAGESAHAAVAVSDPGVEKQIQQRRQGGIAHIFVVPGHGTRLDLAAKAVAHHDVVALPPPLHKVRHFAEIITVVGITHHDERAARRRDSRAQRRAVTARFHTRYTRAQLFRNLYRAVRRAIVGHHHFSAQPRGLKCIHRFGNTNTHRVGLVQTRNYHRDVDGGFAAVSRIRTAPRLQRFTSLSMGNFALHAPQFQLAFSLTAIIMAEFPRVPETAYLPNPSDLFSTPGASASSSGLEGSAATPSRGRLLKVLGMWFGISAAVGNTIAAGIVRAPGDIAQWLPNMYLFFGVWVAGGLYALFGASSMAELGAAIPRSGGQYNFSRRALGEYAGFIVGWSDWLSTCGTAAAVAIVIGEYSGNLILPLAGHVKLIAVLVIIGFFILQWRGIKWAGARNWAPPRSRLLHLSSWWVRVSFGVGMLAWPLRPPWLRRLRFLPVGPWRWPSCWDCKRSSTALTGGTGSSTLAKKCAIRDAIFRARFSAAWQRSWESIC